MHQIKAILAILSPAERRSAYGLLVMMIIGMIMETMGIGLVIPAISLFMEDNIGKSYPILLPLLDKLGNPDRYALVVYGLSFLVAVYGLKTFFMALLVWQQNQFNNKVQVHLSKRLFQLYLRQPYSYHLMHNSAQLIRNVTIEIGYFLNMGLTAIMTLVTESLVLIGIVLLLFTVEPVGSLGIVLLVGSACLIFQRSTASMVARWGSARQTHDGLRIQQVQQGLGGAKDVKLLGREMDFLDKYDHHNIKTARACVNLSILQAMPRLWLELMTVIGMSTIVLIMVSQGEATKHILPTLGLFAAAAFRLMPSVSKILVASQSVRFGKSAVVMLQKELQLEIPQNEATTGLMDFADAIEFHNVSFTYLAAATPAIRDISFTISRGETIGIVGPSGSGKSTLIDVILGLLQPDSGNILVDGRDIQNHLRSWQNRIGYVPQSIFLTDDTLRSNIAFGVAEDQIRDADVMRALQSAHLDTFVRSLPDGINTIVGERGIRLSGGQRQRIGIARALYHDPSVIVLDEATSALDDSTESEVMAAIHELRGEKTVIIVAHRLSTVESCDRIFRLKDGRLMETGTPDLILRKIDISAQKSKHDLGLIA